MGKRHVGATSAPSKRKVKGSGAKKVNDKATFQRAMTDASALTIRNRKHPFNIWVTEMVGMLDLEMLKSLVDVHLNGQLDDATAEKLFSDQLKPQERAKAYAFAGSLGGLPPGLIADRAIIEPAHALRCKLWSTATLATGVVARLDRHCSQTLWDLREWPGFEFEGFKVGPRGAPRQIEIANHAAELLSLHRNHPNIFDDVMAGRYLRAFTSACTGTTAGVSIAQRDRNIKCIATQFAVCAIEHSQRAHGWMISVRRSCVPTPLQHEITAGSLQLGGVKAIDHKIGALAKKYLARYDPKGAVGEERDLRGGKGNFDLMLREIVKERFSETDESELRLWHDYMTTVIVDLRLATPAKQIAHAHLSSQLDVMTHWFRWTERELLLCIDLRVTQARAIARSIIAQPELACGPDLEALLYPERFPDKKMGLGSAAQKICLEMNAYAQAATVESGPSGEDEGNRKAVDRAYDLLAFIEGRQRQTGLAPTRSEQFFDAIDPLRPPSRPAFHTYRPGRAEV